MGSCDRTERRFYGVVRVEAYPVHEAVQPVASEVGFHYAEDGLNRIKFRRVAHVENILYVKPGPPFPQGSGFMNRKLIHEQSDRLAPVS